MIQRIYLYYFQIKKKLMISIILKSILNIKIIDRHFKN